MYPNSEWFSTYQQIDGGNVSMANGVVCKIVGIGSVKIRTHNGAFYTLKEVRHVPLMKKSLISFSVVDGKGFSFEGKGGAMYVYKGFEVDLKGIKRGTLYFLLGSTIIGYVVVASSVVHKDDMTKLWHMRLASFQKVFIVQNGHLIIFIQTVGDLPKLNLLEAVAEGIVRHHTVRNTPQQNGVAERMYQTLFEKARCMLSNARESSSVDKQVEMQFTSVVNELQHQGGEDQYVTTETDVQPEINVPRMSEVALPENSRSRVDQPSIACDRARSVGVGPPVRYGFENIVTFALQVSEEVDSHEPSTYREAMSCGESAQWLATMGD
ncbi:uncharacterized protein LOC120067667 [Benincasa hispida]|uniref:uncharacterized protein LOC120067667 n=1 Tax=Benincasa hispida TaxID=102211 RepID=UPI0019021CD8|nr:uncharacterized protein LOC120067667 [Benincasa hispida]